MTLAGVEVPPAKTADAFAKFFQDKVLAHSSKALIKDDVYNGKCKLIVQNRNFMCCNDVKACLNDLTSKKCEGFDRILVCLLFDARAALLQPLTIGLVKNVHPLKSFCIIKQFSCTKLLTTKIFLQH